MSTTDRDTQDLLDAVFRGKPLPPRRAPWPSIVGKFAACVFLGAVAWAFAHYVADAPSWAALCVGWLTFTIYRAADFVVGMGRRGWK